MTFGQPTTIAAVLTAIAARVVASGEYHASQVFLSLADDDDHSQFPAKDVFVVIAPVNGVPVDDDVTGGGNDLFDVDLQINIKLWVRLGLDVPFHDADQLTNATLGQLMNFGKILTAMQQYYPDASGSDDSSIFREPARCKRFDFAPRKPTNGWAKMQSTWHVPVRLDLEA